MFIARFHLSLSGENVFSQGMVVLFNPVCILLSRMLHVSIRATKVFAGLDDLQNAGFENRRIVWTCIFEMREARRRVTFHAVTDITLSQF